jgi:ACS family D-galactonate transporter-like MFS transporter
MCRSLRGRAGVLIGGFVADRILKRGRFGDGRAEAAGGRRADSRLVPGAGELGAAGPDALVVVIMSVAFFGQGMTNLGWTVVTDLAPKQMIGLAGGFFNMITNFAGILTPVILGAIKDYTGSYFFASSTSASCRFRGALYIFALGDIKRLEVSTDGSEQRNR